MLPRLSLPTMTSKYTVHLPPSVTAPVCSGRYCGLRIGFSVLPSPCAVALRAVQPERSSAASALSLQSSDSSAVQPVRSSFVRALRLHVSTLSSLCPLRSSAVRRLALHSSVVSFSAADTSSAVSALYEHATVFSALQPVRSSTVSAQLEASSCVSALQPASFRLCSLPQPDTSSFSSLVMPLRSSAVIWLPHAISSCRFVKCSIPVMSATFVIFISNRSMHCTASHSAAESLLSLFVSQ